MGDYLTREALAKQLGYTEAKQLAAPADLAEPLDADFRQAVKASPGAMTGTSEEQDAANEAATRIDTAIDQAEAIINDALSSAGYQTPATASDSLAWMVRAMAHRSLYTRTEIPEGIKLERDAAMKRLREIREGKLTLDGATREQDAVPKTRARDQVFTDEILDSFPG